MKICRANGRFLRRCARRRNVDIGSAPSYLSFDFASRSDFRAWLIVESAFQNNAAGQVGKH
jgi:hypothetical protein